MMDDEDCYIFCGTSLPDPEDGPSAQKRANRELQVRDEKGRQRFHGAFTGGFSAGYFNTVSTKEGWTPSTFVSSRTKAAERMEQQPEDFMDAEDFSEFGIAPKKIHTTTKFRDAEAKLGKRKDPIYSDAVIPGEPPLKELVQPVAQNIGIQILMSMGWKPGQGIGPRVRKGNTKKASGAHGALNASSDSNHEAEDPMLASFTFAPEDTASLPYTPKDDFHGIGYTGLSTKSVLSAPSVSFPSSVTKSWLEKSKAKLSISGKAFGIGALEEDDDIDIYSHEDMSQYDFSEFTSSQEKTKDPKTVISEKPVVGVVGGFLQSKKVLTVRKTFPLPQLPSGYTPIRRSVHAPGVSEPTSSRHQTLTAEDRSLMLGERKFVTIDFHRSDSSASKPSLTVNQGHSEHNANNKTVPSGFRPFGNDSEKQKRYEEYLKLSQKECIKALQPACMTEWEKAQELEEFTRAASLYQPMSKILSSRFVSKTHLAAESQGGIVKVEKPPSEKAVPSGPPHQRTEWHPAPLLCRRFNITNPYPNSSNVGVPHSEKMQKSLFSCLSFENESEPFVDPAVPLVPQETKSGASIKVEPEEVQEVPEDPVLEPEGPSVSTNEEIAPGVSKPPMDLFKAIFENTSEEEDDEEEKEKEQNSHSDEMREKSSSPKTSVTNVSDKPNNAPVTARPPTAPKKGFGVFANLDLDLLNASRLDPSNMTAASGSSSADPVAQVADASGCRSKVTQMADGKGPREEKPTAVSEGFYGPQLPPPGFIPPSVQPKSHSRKHSRCKEKHKHHKHKKKSKKQKKKRSSKGNSRSSSNSSASSDSDDDDVDPLTIIKKLDELRNKSKKKHGKF